METAAHTLEPLDPLEPLTGSPPMSFESNLDSPLKRGYVAAVRFLGDRDAAPDACHKAASRALAARAQGAAELLAYGTAVIIDEE